MTSKEIIRWQIAEYRALAEQLRKSYRDIDDETLADTLEGITALPEMIEEIVRSSLEDAAMAAGLKLRLDDMHARLTRLKERYERKRELVLWAMVQAQLNRLEVEEFSVSVAQGGVKLEVSDESKLPGTFLIPQPPKLDRVALLQALKRGDSFDGASLTPGSPHLTVRTK